MDERHHFCVLPCLRLCVACVYMRCLRLSMLLLFVCIVYFTMLCARVCMFVLVCLRAYVYIYYFYAPILVFMRICVFVRICVLVRNSLRFIVIYLLSLVWSFFHTNLSTIEELVCSRVLQHAAA